MLRSANPPASLCAGLGLALVAMPTWVDDGGTKCGSTTQWTRLDRPNALSFLGCGLVVADAAAVRSCVDDAFPSS